MIKILITGANGQLGQSILKFKHKPFQAEWISTDFEELDITDEQQVIREIDRLKPAAVINCAAYTKVDQAEKERKQAMALNAGGPDNLAKACHRQQALLIHTSTDYIFSGHNFRPYIEKDIPGPESYYGETKLRGEKAVIHQHNRSVILRTSWLYSPYGHNFVKTIFRLSKEKDELRVVSDQIGSPTLAEDLAHAVLKTASYYLNNPDELTQTEIFHVANTGVASWYDLAVAIIRFGKIDCRILPVTSEEYPLPAPRPMYSVLDTSKFRTRFWPELPHWQERLQYCIRQLTPNHKK